MKRCRKCLAEVSPDAVHCPQCGRELGPEVTLPSSSPWWSGPSGSWRIATIAAGVIGALLLLFFLGSVLDPARDPGIAPVDDVNMAAAIPPPARTLAPVATTAEELSKAYDENELTARDRFEGRPIRVAGTVLRIGSNQGEPTLLLQSSHTIAAAFADPAPLKALKAGDQITITCEALAQAEAALVLKKCVVTARDEPAAPATPRVGPQ